MPSWWIHRYFAEQLGINPELSRIVDEIIDFAHILPDEYETPYGVFRFPEGIEKRHDWAKFYPIDAGKAFNEAFGEQGVKAMVLHIVLDFISEKGSHRIDFNEILSKFKRDEELYRIAEFVINYVKFNIDEIVDLIKIDKNPKEALKLCDFCGEKIDDLVQCKRCGILFPGWLRILFLEEKKELSERISKSVDARVVSLDKERELMIIQLISKYGIREFEEGMIVGIITKDKKVEKIGRIVHIDEEDNELTIDFSETNLPTWLKKNMKIKVTSAESLIGLYLQQAWILEARRNFRYLREIIYEIMSGSLSDATKRSLENELKQIIENAKRVIDLFLNKKYKEIIEPINLEDEYSLNGKFKLDESQINIVGRILNLKDGQILVVVGPPGTGKTEVIAKSAYELAKRGEKVLITSHTNIAVDNALEKLADKKDIEIVRVGRPEKISDKLKKVMLSKIKDEKAPKDLLNEIKLLKEKLKELRNLRQELRETRKSDIYDLIPKIYKMLNRKFDYEVYYTYIPILKAIDKEIQDKKNYIEKGLKPYSSSISVKRKMNKFLNRIKELRQLKRHYSELLKAYGIKSTKEELRRDLENEINEKTKKLIGKKKELKELLEIVERVTLSEANIIGSTIIRSHLGTLFGITFDTVIIDECSQVSIPLGFMGLIKAKKWVIIGDHLQLLPIFRILRDIEASKKASLFSYIVDKIKNEDLGIQIPYLKTHYRSYKEIIEFSKKYIYDKKNFEIEIDKNSGYHCKDLENLLDRVDILRYPVIFIDVDGKGIRESEYGKRSSVYNDEEVLVCYEIVKALEDVGIDRNKIGIITPYVAQVRKLKEKIKGIEINTVDSFQGREKDVIIFSVTGTNKNSISFASHPNRLNVALTRARCRLIVIGNAKEIRKTDTLLKKFLTEYIETMGYLFDWKHKKWIKTPKL